MISVSASFRATRKPGRAAALLLACVFGFGGSHAARADWVSAAVATGERAYARAQYVRAAEVFLAPAQAGAAKAQTYLGYMYLNGLGAPQDFVAARGWLTLRRATGRADRAVSARRNLRSRRRRHNRLRDRGGLVRSGRGACRAGQARLLGAHARCGRRQVDARRACPSAEARGGPDAGRFALSAARAFRNPPAATTSTARSPAPTARRMATSRSGRRDGPSARARP